MTERESAMMFRRNPATASAAASVLAALAGFESAVEKEAVKFSQYAATVSEIGAYLRWLDGFEVYARNARTQFALFFTQDYTQ